MHDWQKFSLILWIPSSFACFCSCEETFSFRGPDCQLLAIVLWLMEFCSKSPLLLHRYLAEFLLSVLAFQISN